MGARCGEPVVAAYVGGGVCARPGAAWISAEPSQRYLDQGGARQLGRRDRCHKTLLQPRLHACRTFLWGEHRAHSRAQHSLQRAAAGRTIGRSVWQRGRTGSPLLHGHAPLVAHRLDAQPRAHGRGIAVREGSAVALAGWCALVLGHAGLMRIWPRTRSAGGGRTVAVWTRHRSHVCSIRPCRRSDSTPVESTSGVVCRSSLGWRFPHVHAPWTAQPMVLAQGGVTLGRSYPWPIMDHPTARACALNAFRTPRAVGGRRV